MVRIVRRQGQMVYWQDMDVCTEVLALLQILYNLCTAIQSCEMAYKPCCSNPQGFADIMQCENA